MMIGYVNTPPKIRAERRIYRVIAKAEGWCIALGEACTFPFKDRNQALRIARNLQRQADALRPNASRPPVAGCGSD